MGPKVPAISGHAVDANHQRLYLVRYNGIRAVSKFLPWIKVFLLLSFGLPLVSLEYILLDIFCSLLCRLIQSRVIHLLGSLLLVDLECYLLSEKETMDD